MPPPERELLTPEEYEQQINPALLRDAGFAWFDPRIVRYLRYRTNIRDKNSIIYFYFTMCEIDNYYLVLKYLQRKYHPDPIDLASRLTGIPREEVKKYMDKLVKLRVLEYGYRETDDGYQYPYLDLSEYDEDIHGLVFTTCNSIKGGEDVKRAITAT